MKKDKTVYENDISFEKYHLKQAALFKKEFEKELRRRRSIEDAFNDELKYSQKMVFIGKLNPIHKQILTEWRDVYPDRFNHFCKQMNDKNRQKLMHFLHLDDDEF